MLPVLFCKFGTMFKFLLFLLFFPLMSFSQQGPGCSDDRNPVVLVHGFLASGDTWSAQVNRLQKNGYCRDRIFLFDWNTTGGNIQKTGALLDAMIDSARKYCHTQQVDLAGHSAGGGLCYNYLTDSVNSLKVAHYIHIGSSPLKGPAGFKGNVPTLIISSEDDKVTGVQKEITGVESIRQKGQDHVQVQTSWETFQAIYSFLNNGKAPLHIAKAPSIRPTVKLSGRAVYFGDNEPVSTDSILLYAVDPGTGFRKTSKPLHIIRSDNRGYWPAVEVASSQQLEWEIHPPGGRVISYFLEPQADDNSCVYLRCLPATGMVSAIFRKLPSDSVQSVLAVFTSQQAMIHGRDSLLVDGTVLTSEELAPANRTILASFIFDDGDGQSSGKLLRSFGMGFFLNGVDKQILAGKDRSIRIFFNGRTMLLPCRPSAEALMVAVFN